MTERARKLIEEALELSSSERAELAAEMLASLPPSEAIDDEQPDPAWSGEIERRAHEAIADPDGGIPWDQARDELLDELRSRRR